MEIVAFAQHPEVGGARKVDLHKRKYATPNLHYKPTCQLIRVYRYDQNDDTTKGKSSAVECRTEKRAMFCII